MLPKGGNIMPDPSTSGANGFSMKLTMPTMISDSNGERLSTGSNAPTARDYRAFDGMTGFDPSKMKSNQNPYQTSVGADGNNYVSYNDYGMSQGAPGWNESGTWGNSHIQNLYASVVNGKQMYSNTTMTEQPQSQKGDYKMAGLVAPSVPINGSNVGMANQGNWTYIPSTAQSSQATGNPATIGGSTQQTPQNQGFPTSQDTSDLRNAFMNANGGISGAQQRQIQDAANQFAQHISNMNMGNYNAAVQHAQSNQEYSNAQAKTAYDSAQNDLNNSSMMSFLKGQQGLVNRGVAGTGGAADDLNVRTGINYQNNLKGLLSNYQNALNAAQHTFGDAQFSAQQALNNEDPTQKAQQFYMQLMNQAQDTQLKQATNLENAYGTSLTNDRTAQYNQGQLENMAAQRQQEAFKTLLQYSMADGNHQYDGKVSRENNQDTNTAKIFGDLMNYDQTNPLTGDMTGMGKLDWAKLREKAGYDKGTLGINQQKADQLNNHYVRSDSTQAYNANTSRMNYQETVQRDQSTANYQVGMLQNQELRDRATGMQEQLKAASSQLDSARSSLMNNSNNPEAIKSYNDAMVNYAQAKYGLDTLLKLGGQKGLTYGNAAPNPTTDEFGNELGFPTP